MLAASGEIVEDAAATHSTFGTGFMTGLGASTAVLGLAGYAMYKRKSAAVDSGAFERV